MKKIVFIGGPTASGKTDLAISIAKAFRGELINADSRQIYKYLDIGTNKGDIIQQNNHYYIQDIPIHLISFLEPDQRYSVFEFKEAALKITDELIQKGKLPVIVGGTGMYIDSIIKNYQLSTESDLKLRSTLENKTLSELQQMLMLTNIEAYNLLNESDRNNSRRLIRSIEKNLNVNSATPVQSNKTDFEYLFIYPEYNWENLVIKIESRVEKMFEDGLIEETKKVLELGFNKDSVALQGTGYKEVLTYLNGEISLAECKDLVKISHRQYAKRQRTWFEGQGRNYNLTKVSNAEEAVEKVRKFYE